MEEVKKVIEEEIDAKEIMSEEDAKKLKETYGSMNVIFSEVGELAIHKIKAEAELREIDDAMRKLAVDYFEHKNVMMDIGEKYKDTLSGKGLKLTSKDGKVLPEIIEEEEANG